MEREELLKKVAPCGLVCYTCTMAKSGIVRERSLALLKLLENFDAMAEQISEIEPRLKNYPDFKELLEMFSQENCEGCRGGDCMYPGCVIQPCTETHGVDFCFECTEFPCRLVNFDRGLKYKWLTANRRMKQIGAEAYFEENRDRSHYV